MASDLANIYANTLSVNADERKTAEALLQNITEQPDFYTNTLNVIKNEGYDVTIRLAATVAYKNRIRAVWQENGVIFNDENGRKQIRELTVEAMLAFPPVISKHFVDAVRIIAAVDFPDSWPELVDILVVNIVSRQGEYHVVHACLSTLEEICLRYRADCRSNELWTEIGLVLTKTSDMLLELCTAYTENLSKKQGQIDDNNTFEILHKVLSIFHSVLAQELPDQFEEKLQNWMSNFFAILELGPRVYDVLAEPVDSLFEEVTVIITHFVQRFSEEITPFVTQFLEGIWKLANTYNQRRGQFSRAALGFFTALASKQAYNYIFEKEEVLPTIINYIVLPWIRLNDDDFEMLVEDPVQFVKEDLDGLSKETVRGAAIELLRTLASRFEGPVVQVILPFINQKMEEYEQNTYNHWAAMDVTFSLITALSSKSSTARYGATSVSQLVDINQFCETKVYTEFNRPDVRYMIAGDCFKFMVHFRNQLSQELISEFFTRHIAERFLNPEKRNVAPVVRMYAAYAVERLLLIPLVSQNRAQLDSQFVELASHLIGSLDQPIGYNNAFILKCLYRLITYLQPDTLKSKCIAFTQVVMQILETAIKKTTYIDSVAVHYTFEIVAFFIKKCFILPEGSERPFYFMYVYPILNVLFNVNNQELEFAPYGLQLACAVVEAYGTVRQQIQIDTTQIQEFFTFLLQSDMWKTSANGPAFVMVIRSYVRHMPQFALSGEYPTAIAGLYSKFIFSKVNDVHAFALASDLLPLMNRVPGVDASQYLIPILNRLTENKTPKFTRNVFVFWMRFIAVRGHDFFKSSLDAIQNTVYPMCMRVLFSTADGDYRYNTLSVEKKWIIVGTLHLLRKNIVPQDEIPKFLNLGIQLLEAFYAAQNTAADENDAVSYDGADAFNKLINVNIADVPDNINFDIRAQFIRLYSFLHASAGLMAAQRNVHITFEGMRSVVFPNGITDTHDFSDLDQGLDAITNTGVAF